MLGVKSVIMNIYIYWKLTRMIDVRSKFCNNEYIVYILKAKSNFTLLLYIPFLGIGEWYFK